jgi:putative hydrolase of the HAD superfamily
MSRGVTCVLLDFFGTLVELAPRDGGDAQPDPLGRGPTDLSITSGGRSGLLAAGAGSRLTYEPSAAEWEVAWTYFAQGARDDLREFSLTQVADRVLRSALDRVPSTDEVQALVDIHVNELNRRVRYVPAVVAAVRLLARDFRLAVVSNTNDSALVPWHLAQMGLAPLIEAVVASVDVGWRKPHPQIYAVALHRLGVGPDQAIFVGDGYLPDFVGPRAVGISSYLIDPAAQSDVPESRRLGSLADLPAALATAGAEAEGGSGPAHE